jgi:hypothetical protein
VNVGLRGLLVLLRTIGATQLAKLTLFSPVETTGLPLLLQNLETPLRAVLRGLCTCEGALRHGPAGRLHRLRLARGGHLAQGRCFAHRRRRACRASPSLPIVRLGDRWDAGEGRNQR